MGLQDKMDQAKGRTKEAAGDMADNEEMQSEGKADQTEGKAKGAVDDAQNKVKDGIDKLRG